jgi:hypothetical protein
MPDLVDNLKQFVHYWESLSGDEKGEAQVFCDRDLARDFWGRATRSAQAFANDLFPHHERR